jgi:cobalamin biosynthesis protein CobT
LQEVVLVKLKKLWGGVIDEVFGSCSLSLQEFLEANEFASKADIEETNDDADGDGNGTTNDNDRNGGNSEGGNNSGDATVGKTTSTSSNSGGDKGSSTAKANTSANAGQSQSRSFTERATTRTQCRKLTKFIRLAQYQFETAITTLAKSTMRSFLNMLRVYSNRDDVVEEADVAALLEEATGNKRMLIHEIQAELNKTHVF